MYNDAHTKKLPTTCCVPIFVRDINQPVLRGTVDCSLDVPVPVLYVGS